MDIIVTTPKSEIANAHKEAKDVESKGGYYFRTFRRRPKVEAGNRIYFVEAGEITGYGIISRVMQLSESQTCDTTGRAWGSPGDYMVAYGDWTWLEERIPYKGFQGYRYVERIPELNSLLNP